MRVNLLHQDLVSIFKVIVMKIMRLHLYSIKISILLHSSRVDFGLSFDRKLKSDEEFLKFYRWQNNLKEGQTGIGVLIILIT